jgi:Ankyrin repeats (many copies)
MISAIQRLGRTVGKLRSRRSTEVDDDQNGYSRPRIRIVDRTQIEPSKSRRFASRASTTTGRSPQELLQEHQTNDDGTDISTNETSNRVPDNNHDSTDLPLLYSLARGWAWEAVTFRCTSHPHEVDVKYRDYRGDTILHWVAFGRPPHEAVHELLVKCPKLAQTPNYSGTLPLHVACSYRASSMVIQEILQAYPEAAAIPDGNGATPIHHLCDYGSGTGRETIASMKVLLRCYPYGIQSVMMTDYRYQRRPIFILNARKNIREQEQYIETIRSRRFRQRAIRQDMTSIVDWNHHLKYELSDQLEDDISNICRDSDFWKLVSRLIVAEYLYTFLKQDHSIIRTVLDRFFGSDISDATDTNNSTKTSDFEEDEEQSIILHAFVHNTDCPQSLQEYAILLYEPFLMKPNPLSSFTSTDRSLLPLHVSASMYSSVVAASGTTDRMSHLLSLLVEGCPIAASVRDTNGQLPLGLLLQPQQGANANSHKVHWSNGMQALIDAYPNALLDDDIDLFSHQQQALRPLMLSALSRNRSSLYSLLRADPTLLLTSKT